MYKAFESEKKKPLSLRFLSKAQEKIELVCGQKRRIPVSPIIGPSVSTPGEDGGMVS